MTPTCSVGGTYNEAARAAATKGTSSAPAMAPLAHALAAAAAAAGVALRTLRVSTDENTISDQLSRGGVETALRAAAAAVGAEVVGLAVPGIVWDLLHTSLSDDVAHAA